LRGQRYQAWTSATKARIEYAGHIRFYYPDASVIACDAFHDEPTIIFEVLSKKTRRIDMVEKKDGYLTIPTLKLYVPALSI
jgi:Uma2 family endonuclease